jgi:hypothetical protein
MNAGPTLIPGLRSTRRLGWFGLAILVAFALTVDARGGLAQSASPPPEATATPTSTSEPTATPEPTPTREPTLTPVPTPTTDPAIPTPDLTRTTVSAWSAVHNPNPARGGPLLLLDGWRFRAAFEDARVIRSQTVTHITVENANPAFWEIEFTGVGPTRAVVTVVPHTDARLLEVRCIWQIFFDFREHPVAATLEGNSVSFEVGRGFEFEGTTEPQAYDCFFIYAGGTAPPTDTLAGIPAYHSHGPTTVLAILLGIVAGALVLTSGRHERRVNSPVGRPHCDGSPAEWTKVKDLSWSVREAWRFHRR